MGSESVEPKKFPGQKVDFSATAFGCLLLYQIKSTFFINLIGSLYCTFFRCFLMDDRGYLITHRDLIEPNNRGRPEEKHITHKEPLIANDILNHRGFVHKKVCSSFGDRTVQRYYQVEYIHRTYVICYIPYNFLIQSINQSNTFARVPVIDDHWRRTSRPNLINLVT